MADKTTGTWPRPLRARFPTRPPRRPPPANAPSTWTPTFCAPTSSSRARTMDEGRDRGAGPLDPRQRHHPADRRTRGGAADTRSSPASGAGAPRSAPASSRFRSSSATFPRTVCWLSALIENIQREDLNPIEEAHAYRRLADEYQLTQEQIADAVGKDRSSIANYLRLLKLPHEVRENLSAGALSMGHARAILALPDEAAQLRLARDVVSKGLSVRETEALIKKAGQPSPPRAGASRRTCTPAPPRTGCASLSARACASSGRGRQAESRSIFRTRTSCSGSTSS